MSINSTKTGNLPRDVPARLERNWFRTEGINIKDLLKSLNDLCDKVGLDSVDKDEFTFQCTTYFRQSEIIFYINVFKDNNAFVIELQHTIGERFVFMQIVKKIANCLMEMNIIPVTAPHIILQEFSIDPSVVLEAVNNNIIMFMKGPHLDVQKDGLQSLAYLSDQECVQEIIMANERVSEFFVLVQTMTQSNIPIIHRLAVAVLANFLSKAHRDIVLSILPKTELRHQLVELLSHSNTIQVWRDCARCLDLIEYSKEHVYTKDSLSLLKNTAAIRLG